MKQILTILILMLSATICRAQKMDFVNERGTYPTRVADVEQLIEEKQGSLSGDDFEFRLYISNSLVSSSRFFVMRRSNGVWNAYVYRRPRVLTWEAVEMRPEGLDSLWKVLEYNKVLTLPDAYLSKNPNIEELYRADAIGRLVMDYIKRNEIKE